MKHTTRIIAAVMLLLVLVTAALIAQADNQNAASSAGGNLFAPAIEAAPSVPHFTIYGGGLDTDEVVAMPGECGRERFRDATMNGYHYCISTDNLTINSIFALGGNGGPVNPEQTSAPNPTSTDDPTSVPSETPDPTQTVIPTETPDPTQTIVPTIDPTETPKPDDPKPTRTPKPEHTPKPTKTPKPDCNNGGGDGPEGCSPSPNGNDDEGGG